MLQKWIISTIYFNHLQESVAIKARGTWKFLLQSKSINQPPPSFFLYTEKRNMTYLTKTVTSLAITFKEFIKPGVDASPSLPSIRACWKHTQIIYVCAFIRPVHFFRISFWYTYAVCFISIRQLEWVAKFICYAELLALRQKVKIGQDKLCSKHGQSSRYAMGEN